MGRLFFDLLPGQPDKLPCRLCHFQINAPHFPADMCKNVLSLDLLGDIPGLQAPAFCLQQRFPGFQLPGYIRKLPESRKQALIGSFFQRVLPVAGNHKYRPILLLFSLLRKLHRILFRRAVNGATAKSAAGAFLAPGLPVGPAESSPQLHQSLCKRSGLRGIYFCQLILDLPFAYREIDWRTVFCQPGNHPEHISVHRWCGAVEAYGANGSRSIIADTG